MLACHRLWLLIAGVCCRGLNWSFGGVVVCGVVSVVGINFDGCGLLLVVASDGYLAVICFVDWDLAVILKFSVIKFVRMLRK